MMRILLVGVSIGMPHFLKFGVWAQGLKRNSSWMLTLRVHVPKQYIHWSLSTYIGTTLRPKYILLGYMDPEGKFGTGSLNP